MELGVGHSGTRNSSRKDIPSSGELALTNKERMVGLVGRFRLAPASQAVARTNQRISQFCSVIEAEDKESAKGERFETYHFFFFPREKREAMTLVLVPPKGSVLYLVVKNLT